MEESNNPRLYSIGSLSNTVGLSIETLRFYDQIGLFKPIHVSRETGYRYYSIDQAAVLARIIELKIVVEALIAGARDFVIKPFLPETLLTTVKSSFQSEKIFNQEILKRIHSQCSDDSYILSQTEVDKIIHVAQSNVDNDDILSVISMLGEKDPDPVLTRLDKLEHGMEELKGMMKQLTDKIIRD